MHSPKFLYSFKKKLFGQLLLSDPNTPTPHPTPRHRVSEERKEQGKTQETQKVFRCTFFFFFFWCGFRLPSPLVEKQEANELGILSTMWILLGLPNILIPGKPGFLLTPTLHSVGRGVRWGRQAAGAVGGRAE